MGHAYWGMHMVWGLRASLRFVAAIGPRLPTFPRTTRPLKLPYVVVCVLSDGSSLRVIGSRLSYAQRSISP